ncbi:MAG: TolC family protein [Bacteroidaceae bacterium]|jgi:outer membrane protein TolC|nr:TolC family protein [Bacteroidaceae bacterium]MBO7266268.1 TolC family protein [Bacteroidaceae bacterium]
MKTKHIITLCLAFISLTTKADTYYLTLEASIELAKEKSYTMLNLKENLKIAEYNLKSATSSLKTHIDFSLTMPEFNQTVRTWDDTTGVSFYSVKRMDYGGTVTVNQPLITNGNIYWETSLNSYDDLYNSDRSATFNTRLRLRQPIDALYGYNSIRSSLKSARLDYERTNKSLRREELNLEYRVSSSYYNLLSLQRSTEIALLDYERQTEANQIAQNKYASGLIREVDALQMEVDLAEAQNSYEMALINQESAINSFKELLGIELTDSVILSDELKYTVVVVDEDKAVEYALKNRTELRDQDIAIEQQQMAIRQRKADGMIRGYFDAYVQKTGTSMDDISTSYINTLHTSATDFMDRPINYGVGITLSVPLLDWGENRARVRAAEARQRQNYLAKEELERSIETETRNSVAQLNNNLKRLQLLEKNVVIAEKSFDITLQRFSDGDIDSQTLALERNRLNSAYRNHLSAYIAYQLSLSDIMRKTLYDFEKDEPLIM